MEISKITSVLAKWYISIPVLAICICMGVFFDRVSNIKVENNQPIEFSESKQYIPLYESAVKEGFYPSLFNVSLLFSNVKIEDDLLLILHFIDTSGKTLHWDKKKVYLIATTEQSNNYITKFYTPHDSIWDKSVSYKLYLWNKDGGEGILEKSRITIR